LKGVKLYSKIMQNPVLKKEFDSIINKPCYEQQYVLSC
jgi:hypothetical protein